MGTGREDTGQLDRASNGQMWNNLSIEMNVALMNHYTEYKRIHASRVILKDK